MSSSICMLDYSDAYWLVYCSVEALFPVGAEFVAEFPVAVA